MIYRDTFATKDYASLVAALIPTVLPPYLASVVSARIHAQLMDLPVEPTHCVVFRITEQCAYAQKDTRENPVKNVTNWNVIMTTTVRPTNDAARMAFAQILACNMVFAASTHSAE